MSANDGVGSQRRTKPGDADHIATLTPLRGITLPQARPPQPDREEPALWFVTITMGGQRMNSNEVRQALERLSVEQPFMVSAGYASSRAELRYWDESVNINGAVAAALELWSQHSVSADLPDWKVVGLEVVDRDTARRRWEQPPRAQVAALGEIRPM